MERRKVMTTAAVLISVMATVGACGKMMGDAPVPAEKAGVLSGDRKAPADSTEKAEAGTADVGKNEKEKTKKQSPVETQTESGQAALNVREMPVLKGEAEPTRLDSSGLLAKVSPETSAMALFVCDGTSVRLYYMLDSEKEKEILDDSGSVEAEPAEDWSAKNASLPIYGIEIGREDGLSLFAAWTNGRWIAQDGSVYQFDYDFEALKQRRKWENAGELPSFTSSPCARVFTQEKEQWNTRFLVPATPLNPPRGITVTLDSWNNDIAAVTTNNENGGEWSCGEFYELQVLIDDVWYEVSAMPGNWGFNCMGFCMPDGSKQSMINRLAMYGELPLGTYRLVIKELSAEYVIP